jgi:hypothetical protein
VNVLDFLERTRGKDDTVGLEALSVATPKFALGISILVD